MRYPDGPSRNFVLFSCEREAIIRSPDVFRFSAPTGHLFTLHIYFGAPVVVMMAAAVILALIRLPGRLVHLYRSERALARIDRNHCPTCDYDLRASPAQCPECGFPAPLPRPGRGHLSPD